MASRVDRVATPPGADGPCVSKRTWVRGPGLKIFDERHAVFHRAEEHPVADGKPAVAAHAVGPAEGQRHERGQVVLEPVGAVEADVVLGARATDLRLHPPVDVEPVAR